MASAAVCGLAAWATASELAVWGGNASTRIALVAAWWVPVAVTAALTLAAALVRLPPAAWRAALFPGVLLLPWLPFPVPAATFAWVGPMAAWVWVGTAVALLAANLPASLASPIFSDPRRAPALAVVLSLFCAGASALSARRVLPAGDAPHYLVITQSLLRDGDLRIENNHRQKDYEAYYRAPLTPHSLRRGQDGQIYSIHAPGLPVLVAPAFAVGGYPGVLVFLILLASAGAWLAWRAAHVLTGSAGAAWFGWAAAWLAAPFFLHTFQVFPDLVGSVITMAGVGALVRLDAASGAPRAGGARGIATWLLLGAALALLPWLHTRFAVIAALLGLFLVLRLLERRAWRELAAFCSVPVAGAAGWFAFFHIVYGTFDPSSPYGGYTQSSAANILRGLPGLLFDQQFGILPNAPVLGIALAGLGVMARRRPRLALEMCAIVFGYLAAVSAYNMWWAGWSAPARFAVPVLLVLALPAAELWARLGLASRAAALAALAGSLLTTVAYVVVNQGRAIFNSRDGFARWLDVVCPLVNVPRALPSFLRPEPGAGWPPVMIWLAVLLLACGVLARMAARGGDTGSRRARLATATPWVLWGAMIAAMSLSWAVGRTEPFTPTTAQLQLLDGYDAHLRPIGLQYKPLRVMPASASLSRVRLATSTRGGRGPAVPLLLTGVPAGTYRLRGASLWTYASLAVVVGRSTRPVERWSLDRAADASNLLIRLPIGVTAVTVTGERRQGGPDDLYLQPVSARPDPPAPGSAPSGADALASRAMRYGDVLALAFDTLAYLEEPGLWITGGEKVRIVLSPDDPVASLRILARNGANPNTVHLRARGWQQTLQMGPRQEQTLDVPIDAASGAVLLEILSEKGFRPVDVDPAVKDERYLGVWLEPAAR